MTLELATEVTKRVLAGTLLPDDKAIVIHKNITTFTITINLSNTHIVVIARNKQGITTISSNQQLTIDHITKLKHIIDEK
jgi:hypothetical protein